MGRNFVYSHTRLQARHGERPGEQDWRTVESQQDLPGFLQSARQTALKNWVSGLQATDDHHLLEASLLARYRDYIEDLARWVPGNWRRSVEWTKSLSYLPALQHLLRGNTPQDWMLRDPVLKQFATTHSDQRSSLLLQSNFADVVLAWQRGQSLPEGWATCWQALWPDMPSGQRAGLRSVVSTVREHRSAFSDINAQSAWRRRDVLADRLRMMFRHYSYQPAAIFVHLLLVALDVERLRGALLQRALFPGYREVGA